MTPLEALTKKYDYPLKPEHIAATPASPRDSSKLLIFDRADGSILTDTFLNLDHHIPPGALLVFNETRVIPARLLGHVATGGKAELLCTRFDGPELYALCERPLTPGEKVWLTKSMHLTVLGKSGKEYRIQMPHGLNIRRYMKRHGITPLPPYLKHSPLTERERREKYQTIFAKRDGSIAAPTASLHFTKRVLKKLQASGVRIAHVTLHVNLGTFMPLTRQNIEQRLLHEEWYEIPAATQKAIASARSAGRPVIPVGTTALRALESAYAGRKVRGTGTTKLFIQEGYKFKIASGLITNFHVPKSSLMMLVASLVGRQKLLSLYDFAINNSFRLLSFGDGMLIR